jgi:uncharacterized protein YjbI with pentapeptide repeats
MVNLPIVEHCQHPSCVRKALSDNPNCILHARRKSKSKSDFRSEFKDHRSRSGDFSGICFPYDIDFERLEFSGTSGFRGAIFYGDVSFKETRFKSDANFRDVEFCAKSDFSAVRFEQRAEFYGALLRGTSTFREAIFEQDADFDTARFAVFATFVKVQFRKQVSFNAAAFPSGVTFRRARFEGGADFRDAVFRRVADFERSSFLSGTVFNGEFSDLIFRDTELNFSQVIVDPLDAVSFREADFTRCRLEDTDVRQLELTGISWPRLGGRRAVFDEIAFKRDREAARHHRARIERLYRELKQNYEDRRDFERAGDFHYGEKEMRRLNPATPASLRFFLTAYWLISGYGERYLPPLLGACAVLIASTFAYLAFGLATREGAQLSLTDQHDWLRAAHYGFRAMLLLKPEDLVPTERSQVVKTVDSVFGPVLLGLFALALRQRLKR